MKTKNIREITKKEKIKGLTRSSWAVALLISGGLYPYLVFWSFPLFGTLLLFFFVIEFFDDDIIEITLKKLKLKAKDEYIA
jgi:hypothetical protein